MLVIQLYKETLVSTVAELLSTIFTTLYKRILLMKTWHQLSETSLMLWLLAFYLNVVLFLGLGCLIIATGIPVYFACVKRKSKPESLNRAVG
jgi:heme A synthase